MHACNSSTYLNGCALNARDAQSHSSVVDLVVGILLKQGVGDLGQTQSLLPVHGQRDYPYAV